MHSFKTTARILIVLYAYMACSAAINRKCTFKCALSESELNIAKELEQQLAVNLDNAMNL